MQYTWDDDKGTRNLWVHGIAFGDAVKIFEGPTLERLDDRFDYPETRWYAIGLAEGRPITVIYTDVDDETRRIISAWKAETHEEKRTSTISKRKTDWRRVDALTDERIRRGIEADPDARPTDEDFWKKATLVMPQVKETTRYRLFFRRRGPPRPMRVVSSRVQVDSRQKPAFRPARGISVDGARCGPLASTCSASDNRRLSLSRLGSEEK